MTWVDIDVGDRAIAEEFELKWQQTLLETSADKEYSQEQLKYNFG